MIISKLKYVVLLVSLFCINACNDSKDETMLDVIETKFDFTAAAGEGFIYIKSSDPVTAIATQLWCTATVDGQTIKVSVSPNNEISARTALLTLSAGDVKKVVRVTQPGVLIGLDAQDGEVRLFASEELKGIALKTNTPVSITIDNPDFVIEHHNDTLYIKTAENTTLVPKRGLITVSMGNTFKQLKVVQNPVWVSPNMSQVRLSSATKRTAITFSRNLCSGWTAKSNADWCKLEQVNDTLFVTVPIYSAGVDARQTSIAIVSGEASIDLPVMQYQPMPANKLFELSLNKWYVNDKQTTGSTLDALFLTKQSLANIDAQLHSIYIDESDDKAIGSHQLVCLVEQKGVLYGASFYYFVSTDNVGQVWLSFDNKFGGNGKTFYDGLAGFRELVNALVGTLNATTDSETNPTYIDIGVSGRSCRLNDHEVLISQ